MNINQSSAVRSSFAAIAAAGVLFAFPTGGSSQTTALPVKFEVASVKPSHAYASGVRSDIAPNGTLTLNTTVKSLILMAYQIKEFQLSGAPGWADSEYYQIDAKAPDGPISSDQKIRMNETSERIRNLLADRFQLAVHHAGKEMREYVLTQAKSGFKLTEREHDQGTFRIALGRGKIATRGGAKVGLLVSVLANELNCPVVDETGLDRYYDIQLNFADANSPPDDTRPSLFTALQEQLGLKLEARKGTVDVIVVDRLERPTQN
jgi:uncharacterized protein (TIGR03435 family)